MKQCWVAVGGALLLTACARIEAPPGGPQDRTPAQLVVTRPDSFAVVPSYRGEVVFVFDERLSEQGVEQAVSVSPRTSPVAVDHSGREIRVSLRRGWVPGQIYHVRVERGLRDLFGNVLPTPVELIFSTGGSIPDTRISGTAIDRVTGRPAVGARVEAIRQADSLVYAVATDSAGAWTLRRFPAGSYQVRVFVDANRNRELDPFEARDQRVVAVSDAVAEPLRLALLLPDSTAPAVARASGRLDGVEVLFDDYLDPAQTMPAGQVRITGPAGRDVPVAAIRVGEAARADTLAADSAAAARPAPLPSRSLFITTEAPLVADTSFRVRVQGVRNVNGLVGGGEAEFRTPAAPPPSPNP